MLKIEVYFRIPPPQMYNHLIVLMTLRIPLLLFQTTNVGKFNS